MAEYAPGFRPGRVVVLPRNLRSRDTPWKPWGGGVGLPRRLSFEGVLKLPLIVTQ